MYTVTIATGFPQENKGSFITFHDDKPLESLASERWEDFNVKVNVTIPELLLWVCLRVYVCVY